MGTGNTKKEGIGGRIGCFGEMRRIGKAATSKVAARKGLGVRVPLSPHFDKLSASLEMIMPWFVYILCLRSENLLVL